MLLHRTPRRRPHLRLPSASIAVSLSLLAFTVCVLVIYGWTRQGFTADHRARASGAYSSVPPSVMRGGAVVDSASRVPRSYDPGPRTVALTFDDGPDPVWTPRVLDVLHRHHVKATFFLIGKLVTAHPELVQRIVREGHEIGVHTFTHPNLGYQPPSRTDQELSLTQLSLAGAAGIHSSLFRPPYSSTPLAQDNRSWRVEQQVGRLGYLTAFVDRDTEDWRRPGVTAIVRSMLPAEGHGAIVLMHDSGGDRSETVTALERGIRILQQRGYRLDTVSGSVGLPDATRPVHGAELWQGRVFLVALEVCDTMVPLLSLLLTVVGGLMIVRLTMAVVLAHRHARTRGVPDFAWGPQVDEPVSVVVPVYNERECIANTVRSLVRSDHPLEIVVVDDGSRDGTADLVESLQLPGVTLVRQPNGGKASALNTGIRRARHKLIVTMDGDTVFEPSTVHELVQPFADPEVGAVAGNAKVGNRGTVLGRWQHIEYVMGFNLDRRMYDMLRCMPTVPGAVGAYRRSALEGVGGLSNDTLAEDTDLTMALHRAGWQVVYAPRAQAWTEAPRTLVQLWQQRYRWSYGTMQAMWKHRRALLEKAHAGRFGRIGLPMVVLFQVATPVLAPLLDMFLVYGVVFQNPVRWALAWLGLLTFQMCCTAYAFRLDRERLRPLWAMPLQQVGYRQLMYLVLIKSCVTAITGVRLRWQKLRHTGEVTAAPPTSKVPA